MADTSDDFVRNPGIPLDLHWVAETRVNAPAVERRVSTHITRRSIKKRWQLAWLLKCVACIDLTTLAGDDTHTNVDRLAFKAKRPLRDDFLEALGFQDVGLTTGAVCVYPNRVKEAVAQLEGTGVPVASVAAGFPAGQTPLNLRLEEIKQAVADGAEEIDIVVSRDLVIAHKWEELYDETVAMREACGDAHLKVILATGDLSSYRDVYKASLVTMMGGADFIKTSTGKEKINATMAVSLVMIRAIRDYYEETGFKVGFKPAGGIRSAKVAMLWLSLMYEELGEEWCQPHLFRIGASSLLTDIERQIEHGTSGHYGADYYMPMGSV